MGAPSIIGAPIAGAESTCQASSCAGSTAGTTAQRCEKPMFCLTHIRSQHVSPTSAKYSKRQQQQQQQQLLRYS
eukprot:6139826-Amphidinium_carterae.1